ncbi:MAG: cysteine synthase family protein [Planctomycetota bacterium]|jgi:cysteine synthase A|nr:cysteine synthase family protein [Planctomycetota bacterium]
MTPYINNLGHTPLVAERLDPADAAIWCKLEFLNPSGSIKDRIAHAIIAKAVRSGVAKPGSMVVEASSGSTSIAMALACGQYGLRFTAIMPAGVSSERVLMIKAYGGLVELTPKEQGIHGAIERASALATEPNTFWPEQFANPDNVEAHRRWTAHELLQQIPDSHVDAVVAGVGTGGTLMGLYLGCRDQGCATVPVLARPVDFASLGDVECCSFSARVPGVIDGLSQLFKPDELPDLITIEVDAAEAVDCTRALITKGYPVGPSSGLNFAAARHLARQHPSWTIATVFSDRMERYFSTELFAPWRD